MKKIYLSLIGITMSFLLNAQCFTQISGTNIACNGACTGTATASSFGTAPFTYMWTPSGGNGATATGLCAGTYSVIVIDANSCTSTASITINEPPVLAAIAVQGMAASCSSCCDGTAVGTATGGTPGYTYLWSPSNQTGPSATGLCPGTYTFCVTDANGCVTCTSVTVTFTTGLNSVTAVNGMQIYPNPTENSFTLKANLSTAVSSEISVLNMLGETVFVKQENASILNESIDISALPQGIYFVQLKTPKGSTVQRLVKQ